MYKFAYDHTNNTESNMMDPCPLQVKQFTLPKKSAIVEFSFQGHRFVKPYYTSYGTLPPLVPTGMWRMDVKVTKQLNNQEVEEVFRFHDYYEVTAKGIEEF